MRPWRIIAAMFRAMELRDGRVELSEGTERVAPPPEGVLRWIDLRGQDTAQLELLRERFDLHPLAIEDCAHLEDLHRIFELKRHLVAMRKVLSPQRDVFGLIAKRGDPRISEKTAVYPRDLYDHR